MRLKGKTAVVTGGASGFGAGIARKFAAEGAQVLVADLNFEVAHEIATEIGGIAQLCNVKALVDLTIKELERIDILVNNAAINPVFGPIEDVDPAIFDKIMDVNVKAPWALSNLVALRRISLNIASTGGVSPRPHSTWYNASKGWMITATKGMAVELAPSGIRVNAINPVAGETPLLKSFMGEDTPEVRAKFLSTIPIGRFSTPEDMGNAACFLCSDEASMITGVCLRVDGGRCI